MQTIILLIGFLAYSAVREYISWKQIQKMQELMKSKDLADYINSTRKPTEADGNTVMKEEPNLLPIDEKTPMDLPEDFKVQWEGDERTQAIKIFR